MNTILTFLAALCAGLSCAAILYLIGSALSSIDIDKEAGVPIDIPKKLPVLIKLVLPFSSNLLPLLRQG